MRIKNANFRFKTLELGAGKIMFAIPFGKVKCWTLSFKTAIGPMLREEIKREKMGARGIFFTFLSHIFEFTAKIFAIDKAIYPNSFGFSTNLYGEGEIVRIIANQAKIKEKFPDKAIILRSLSGLNFRGRNKNYKLIPSRVIWVLDRLEENWLKRTDVKNDLEILKANKLEIETYDNVISDEIMARCLELYHALYIEKYSKYNPEYSATYLQNLLSKGIIKIHTLSKESEILAFCITQTKAKTLVSPMMGYDMQSPIPLYRAIMLVPPMVALEDNLLLNNSSGAPQFKKNRGSRPIMEYILVIDDHLPFWRRLGYSLFSNILSKFENLLLKEAVK